MTKKAINLLKLKTKYKLENCYFPGYVDKKYFTFLLRHASVLTLGLKKNEIWSVLYHLNFRVILIQVDQ